MPACDRRAWLGTAAAALAVPSAPAALAAEADNAATVRNLTTQADAWDAAIVRKDRAAVEANMADDFRQIDGDGDVEDKASFLEGILSPKLVIHPYTVEDFDVRLYGDVALLSGRTRMTGAYDGKPWSSHYRYVDVYARRNGRWQVVNVQISRIKPTP